MSKELYQALDDRGLLEYGSVIPAEFVRSVIGVEIPAIGTRRQFQDAALLELGAVDYVRRLLLEEGKYIAGHHGDYRILTPSENQRQIQIYMSQADKKLKRAMVLAKTTPKVDNARPDHVATRIMLKRDSIRRYGTQPSA